MNEEAVAEDIDIFNPFAGGVPLTLVCRQYRLECILDLVGKYMAECMVIYVW